MYYYLCLAALEEETDRPEGDIDNKTNEGNGSDKDNKSNEGNESNKSNESVRSNGKEEGNKKSSRDAWRLSIWQQKQKGLAGKLWQLLDGDDKEAQVGQIFWLAASSIFDGIKD